MQLTIEMKEFLIVTISLLTQLGSYGQSVDTVVCSDTTQYEVFTNDADFPALRVYIEHEWKTFILIEELADQFSYDDEQIQLNGTGSCELVIRWRNSMYGSGGGSVIEGVQIWDLDNGINIFNEIVSCSDESFGRHESPSYLIECQKKIEITNNTLIISEKSCDIEWSETEDIPDPTENCELTAYDAGTYVFRNGKLELQ